MREFHGHAIIDADGTFFLFPFLSLVDLIDFLSATKDRIDYAFVQRALFQRVPKKPKVDTKEGTIDEGKAICFLSKIGKEGLNTQVIQIKNGRNLSRRTMLIHRPRRRNSQ